MSSELLAILDHIERERGINKDVLIQAVESAMVSAVKKVVGAKTSENIRVTIDRADGKIHAYIDEAEIKSVDFGRIAAQTAKQVIIQKIREAEKDVIFHEFSAKVGDIVSGTVYRFDKGNIIIDLLGKAEGLMPKREQSPRDDFRQGQRVRAYVLDVKREAKGPQIILSRASREFLTRLFEQEIPEIQEGLVLIKSVAREPGVRAAGLRAPERFGYLCGRGDAAGRFIACHRIQKAGGQIWRANGLNGFLPGVNSRGISQFSILKLYSFLCQQRQLAFDRRAGHFALESADGKIGRNHPVTGDARREWIAL